MKKFWKYEGMLWIVDYEIYNNQQEVFYAIGPYCPKCKTELNCYTPADVDDPFEVPDNCSYVCMNLRCEFKATNPMGQDSLKKIVVAVYESKMKEGWKIEALDIPPGKVSDTDNEDKHYWVSASMGQKNGEKMGVVYFGDKSKRGSKAQLFVDYEDELVRFDKGDRNPLDIASEIIIKFPKSEQKFKVKK